MPSFATVMTAPTPWWEGTSTSGETDSGYKVRTPPHAMKVCDPDISLTEPAAVASSAPRIGRCRIMGPRRSNALGTMLAGRYLLGERFCALGVVDATPAA